MFFKFKKKKQPDEPAILHAPCDYCNFYASRRCRNCAYLFDLQTSIIGEYHCGGYSEEDARKEAGNIYREFEREERAELIKKYPVTGWLRWYWANRVVPYSQHIRIKLEYAYKKSLYLAANRPAVLFLNTWHLQYLVIQVMYVTVPTKLSVYLI